jgi:hypothetical protein
MLVIIIAKVFLPSVFSRTILHPRRKNSSAFATDITFIMKIKHISCEGSNRANMCSRGKHPSTVLSKACFEARQIVTACLFYGF